MFFLKLFIFKTILLSSLFLSAQYNDPLESSKEMILSFESLQDFNEQRILIDQIYENKELYDYLKSVFKILLNVDAKQATQFNLKPISDGLSEPQLLFLLQKFPEWKAMLIQYLDALQVHTLSQLQTKLDDVQKNKNDFRKFRLEQRKFIRDQATSQKVLEFLKRIKDPTLPFIVRFKDQKIFSLGLESYINHPYLILSKKVTNPDLIPKKTQINKSDDLKKVVIEFIRSAKRNIKFNFFEFDLVDVAEELINLNESKGIKITGGIDKKTIQLKSTNVRVAALFNTQSKIKDNFIFSEVDASGLNHQKIIIVDEGTEEARVLFLSGNMTQSCLGPEGDLIGVSHEIHKGKSKPNANNALLVKNSLVAAVAGSELDKILLKRYRGQRDFPVSGSYVFEGELEGEKQTWLKLAFSPNGGIGDVGRDTLNAHIRSEPGAIWAMQFAFSSPEIRDALIDKIKQRVIYLTDDIPNHLQIIPEVLFTGDPSFSLREWAAPLHLSGLKKDVITKKYSVDLDNNLFKGLNHKQIVLLENELKKIRLSTTLFGDFYFPGGYKASVKLHHKFFSFPNANITTVGTSYNTSNNAEGNMEQIVIVKSESISKKLNGAFLYLYRQSEMSLKERAFWRNKNISPDEDKNEDSIVSQSLDI